MKEIVFIIPGLFNFGGVARVTIHIANMLVETNDYKVTLLSLFRQNEEKLFFQVSSKINIIVLPINKFNLRKDFLKAAYKLKKIYSDRFEGTFVIDDVGHAIPAWIGLRHCKNAKFICWSHMNFFNGSKYGFSGIGKRLAVKKFDHLIALTKEDQGYYKKILHAENVVQIYNPQNSEVVKQNYAQDSKKIISCGRLHQIKGFDLLIDVAKYIFRKVDDWEWDIYGDGPEKDNLQQKIDRYGLTERVHLKGYSGDILSLYKDYSFCVFTSRGEGCPMAMIEALSAGLPMVSFDFKCGPRDLITDDVNGYIVRNWDIGEMADKVLKLIYDKELRIKFSQHADVNLHELESQYVLSRWEEIL